MKGEENPIRKIYREKGILYIEPSEKTSAKPVIDELTRKMTAAFRQTKEAMHFMGWHTCSCGAKSTCCDYELPNGQIINSLCIHYLAYHRGEVPQEELDKVARLNFGEEEPGDIMLKPPQ